MADPSNLPNGAQLVLEASASMTLSTARLVRRCPPALSGHGVPPKSLTGDRSTRRLTGPPDAIYLLRPDRPTESVTGATSLIVSGAFCDLVRQRQLVGLAQPGDHREGDGCHRHQQEGPQGHRRFALSCRWRSSA